MASLIKKLGRASHRRSCPDRATLMDQQPRCPPSPSLDHLTTNEIQILNNVFSRLERVEHEETNHISRLEWEVRTLEDRIEQQTSRRGSVRHVDLRLCRLCFRTKFADGIGRACAECQRRVCGHCGTFTKMVHSSNKRQLQPPPVKMKGQWRCLLCQKRRELACASGKWFNGGRARPAINSSVFRRKLSDGCAADIEQSDSSHLPRTLSHKTDSEVAIHSSPMREEALKLACRKGPRRRLLSATSTEDTAEPMDDDEMDVDDEQFLLERQRCRQERHQMQKKTRKKSRRSSVGTCTREDGIVEAPCPQHGSSPPEQQWSPPGNQSGKGHGRAHGGQGERGERPSRKVAVDNVRGGGGGGERSTRGGNTGGMVNAGTSTMSSQQQQQQHLQRELSSSNDCLESSGREKQVVHPRIKELTTRKVSAPSRMMCDYDSFRRELVAVPFGDGGGGGGGSGRPRAGSGPCGETSAPHPQRVRRTSSEGDQGDLALSVSTHVSDSDSMVSVSITPPTVHRKLPRPPCVRTPSTDTSGTDGSPSLTRSTRSRSIVPPPDFTVPTLSPNSPTGANELSLDDLVDAQNTSYLLYCATAPDPRAPQRITTSILRQDSFPSSNPHLTGGERRDSWTRDIPSLRLPTPTQEGLHLDHNLLLAAPCRRKTSDPGRVTELPDALLDLKDIIRRKSDSAAYGASPPLPGTLLGRSDADSTSSINIHTKRSRLRRSSSCHRFRVVLQRDMRDTSRRTMGLGMRVVGGKQGPEGKLGAFVTWVVKGGAADMGGISEGNQILEWNGQSLEDATFEEVQQVTASSGDTVQLIVLHTRDGLDKQGDYFKPTPSWKTTLGLTKNKEDGSPGSKRRERTDKETRGSRESLLSVKGCASSSRVAPDDLDLTTATAPPTSAAPSPCQVEVVEIVAIRDEREISGRVQLKMWHDPRVDSLLLTLIQAQDLNDRPGPERERPYAFARIILAAGTLTGDIKTFKTEVVMNCKDPDWKKTFEINKVSKKQLQHSMLLVTVWDMYLHKPDVFLGEVLLDLSHADTRDSALWYPLGEHDENAGPLPMPTPKSGRRDVEGGVAGIPATPAHDKVKELLSKQRDAADEEQQKSIAAATAEEVQPKRPLTGSKMNMLKRRVSEVAMKVGAILVDKRSPTISDRAAAPIGTLDTMETIPPVPLVPPSNTGRRHSLAAATNNGAALKRERRFSAGLVFANLGLGGKTPLSRGNSQSSQTGNTSGSDGEGDDEEGGMHVGQRPAPEGDDITSMLGPGQVPPKPSLEKLVKGDVKLGFMITKGQLEIDVICAKGLSLTASKQSPSTYVKTYLVGNGKRMQKKKTKHVKNSTDPLYRQKLKYSACNVHGRYMQILIKEKTSGFDKNCCLGVVVIKLDSLDLSHHTMGWYKLFKECAVDLGSSESLTM